MEHQYIIDNEIHSFECDVSKNACKASFGEKSFDLEFFPLSENTLLIMDGSASYTVYFVKDNDSIHIFIEGEKYILKPAEESSGYANETDTGEVMEGLVATPMPGTIIKFLVNEGDTVEIDQGLVIVEAMKMENEIRSTIKGRVKKINFQPGDAVDVGQSIIDLEEISEEGD